MTLRMAQSIDNIGGLGSDSDRTLKEGENAVSKRERSGDDDGMLPGLILMPRNSIINSARGKGNAGARPWAARMKMMGAVPRGGHGTFRRLGLGAAMMMEMMAAAPRGGGGSGSERGDALARVSGGRTSIMMMTMKIMMGLTPHAAPRPRRRGYHDR
jgi:hypothetical protein